MSIDSSNNNIIFLNSFDGNGVNNYGDNIWYTLRPVGYRCGDIWGEGRLGNYWSSYTGNDTDGTAWEILHMEGTYIP